MAKLTAVGPLSKAAEVISDISSTEFVVSVGVLLYTAAAIVLVGGAVFLYRNWSKRRSGEVSATRSDLVGRPKPD